MQGSLEAISTEIESGVLDLIEALGKAENEVSFFLFQKKRLTKRLGGLQEVE